jgi:hypothetical protein
MIAKTPAPDLDDDTKKDIPRWSLTPPAGALSLSAPQTKSRRNAVRLDSIAKVIRSKNAGPCLLTLDVMLPDEATFAYVAARIGPLRRQVARRYGRSENEVAVLPFAPALAVKITLPRDVVSGDVGDRDVYGAQQHAPLLDIEL